MIERIRKKYAMTEKGARDYVAAVFWSVLVNISKMLPVGVLATALSGIVEALTNGTDPGAGLARFLVAGILDPKEFIDTVLNVRIPNPFMPDTPQRIATDTSQKLAIRFGETVKNYLASKDKDIKNLKLIPLVFAGWLRYLMAVDDNGEKFELSPDPLLETVCPVVAGIKFGDTDVEEMIRPLLTNRAIFGVDLYEAGLAGLTVQYFKELIAGAGAVRATLKKYV